ncbi:Myosin regulatory light chain cdc4 [Colletotrichum plurivorum]|uniref:Calmodulin n=1 Tax=Colletotrichum plurivorum TaxID=2175906 RepID=A0A8H6N6T8_9PEZI|nr:Myosin regulatory light chain cdc4 [Colletotrichum plurivorum]
MSSNQYDAQASTNYKEAFSLFDKRGNGRVALDSLGDLLRACGQNPTLTEIRDLEKNVGGDYSNIVDFETFQRILTRPGGFRDPGEPEEYCRGFQVFDKDMTGFIGVGQLKYILTNLGEKMTDEEVDELLKAVDTSSGQVNYTGTHPPPPNPIALESPEILTRYTTELVRTILAN